MAGTVLGVVAVMILGGASLLLATMLGLRSLVELVLATYVIGFTLAVALVLLVSVAGGELSQGSLIVGSLAVLASAAGVRLLAGGTAFPRTPATSLRALSRSGPLVALGAIAAAGLAYAIALIAGTPPNGWDQLNYHLARAAFWVQSGVGYLDSAYDDRLNIYPPNGEIPFSFLLGLTGDENSAAFAQLVAALACTVGVAALAKRFGASAAEAWFGALLFLMLPIVLLQSATTKNDVVLASLLVASAVLLLGESRRVIALGGLAVALAMGAKFTAGYGVLVLLALVLVDRPALPRWRVGAVIGGALLGSYWYAVNALQGGGLLGERQGIPGLTAFLSPPENVLAFVGLSVDWLDLSGAVGRDLLLYAIVAVLVAAVLVLTGGRSGSPGWRPALVAGALVASPLLIWVLTTQVGRPAVVALSDALGTPQAYLAEGAGASSPTGASDTGSWFGPVGLVFVLGTAVAAVALVRRRALPRGALVVAGAPFVWQLLVAASLTYHPWQGRFFIFPVALSASLWGLVLRRHALAWAAVGLSCAGALLTFVHYEEKPSGLRLLEPDRPASVWTMKRSQVQTLHDPSLASLFEFLDERIPAADSIALTLGTNDFGYPAFGANLQRAVTLVPFGSSAREVAADWLYANPERAAEIDRSCWAVAFESDAGVVFRRTAGC